MKTLGKQLGIKSKLTTYVARHSYATMLKNLGVSVEEISESLGHNKNKEYTDLLAIQDTAKEVQNLKQKGIQVIGIFMGSARSGEVAGKIFGQNLIKIRNISDFSQAVGRVLQEIVFS